VVVAHPDDESCFAATIYEITHNLGGIADQLVITDGEGGYRYSLLAESYYGVPLTNEPIGQAALPEIRKQELLGSGRVLGIAKHFVLDERDVRYTQDVNEVLTQHWDAERVKGEILRRLASDPYDLVFTLFPTVETHGAHKAAALVAIDAVMRLPGRRPVVLGCQDSTVSDNRPLDWTGFRDSQYPFAVGPERYSVDRGIKFGFNNVLSYQVVVNWVIAEYKSQGAFQMDMNRFDHEQFAVLGSGTEDAEPRTGALFQELEKKAASVNGQVWLSQSLCRPPAMCKGLTPSQSTEKILAQRDRN
jgi:LmbE family N-acetylglucosaminyl deacetylase